MGKIVMFGCYVVGVFFVLIGTMILLEGEENASTLAFGVWGLAFPLLSLGAILGVLLQIRDQLVQINHRQGALVQMSQDRK